MTQEPQQPSTEDASNAGAVACVSQRPTRNRNQRGAASSLVIGGSALAAVALVGGGAFAASQLSGGGQQPSDVLPADTLAVARVDLDPSAGQKVALLRLLRQVPEFEETTGISSDKEDLRRKVVESALEEFDCDVDYQDDIEPWIGDRLAFAAVPGKERPDTVALLQVTDTSAAESGLAAVTECFGGESAPGAFAFSGDYAVIAESQEVADRVVSDAEQSSLADEDGYVADMERMGDAGVASYWVDVPAVGEELEKLGTNSPFGFGYPEMGSGFAFGGWDAGGAESSFGVLRASDESIELAAYSRGEQLADNASSPVAELPESTLAAFSISGLGDKVPELWDRLREAAGGDDAAGFDAEVADFEQESGLQLPEDLATLLGDNLTFALDAEGLGPETFSQETTPADVGLGVRFSGDTAAITDVVDRVQAALVREQVPFELVTEEVDGGVVVASNADYATRMTDKGITDSAAFEQAVGDVDETAGVFFLDLDKAADIAAGFEGPEGQGGVVSDYLEPMRALGVNATVDGEYSEAFVRLTFDD